MHNTIQCEAVLKVLYNSKEHLSADEIYHLLTKEISQLSLATVYRNLKKLEAIVQVYFEFRGEINQT